MFPNQGFRGPPGSSEYLCGFHKPFENVMVIVFLNLFLKKCKQIGLSDIDLSFDSIGNRTESYASLRKLVKVWSDWTNKALIPFLNYYAIGLTKNPKDLMI